MNRKVLILGGYGNFGSLIADYLSERTDIQLIIAGRNIDKANNFCNELKKEKKRCEITPISLDIFSNDFCQSL